jgi:outer membrane protein assembly factor BamB
MKLKYFVLFGALLVLGVLVSGCASNLSPSSWAGVSADANNAYIAGGPYVYAVNLETGAQAWRFPAKASSNPFFATPAIAADGQVIVSGFDHKLYSLSPQSGLQNWVFDQARDRYYGGALVSGEAIYAPNADYNLYALDMHGNLKWTFQADQSLWAAPVSDGQRVYLGTLGRKVYAVDAGTGKQVWQKTLDGAVLGSPALSPDGLLYVNTYAGSVVALDPASGEIRWQQKAASWIWGGPILDGGDLFLGDSTGAFYAFDAAGGRENWHQSLNGAVLASPVSTGENIIVGTEGGNVYFLDRSGKAVHTLAVTGKVYTAPVAAGTVVLVAPTGAATQPLLVAFDQTGVQKWTFTPAK